MFFYLSKTNALITEIKVKFHHRRI